MNLFRQGRKFLIALSLVLMLITTTACGSKLAEKPQSSLPTVPSQSSYGQLSRGNSDIGQDFGNWVVGASKGLVKDAYVRDNNKLGVIITPQVRPNEVKDLAKSLTQGFHKNFPNQDLKVLMYAPDKQLILTALYDTQSKQIEFEAS
jgi:hypothetical protein